MHTQIYGFQDLTLLGGGELACEVLVLLAQRTRSVVEKVVPIVLFHGLDVIGAVDAPVDQGWKEIECPFDSCDDQVFVLLGGLVHAHLQVSVLEEFQMLRFLEGTYLVEVVAVDGLAGVHALLHPHLQLLLRFNIGIKQPREKDHSDLVVAGVVLYAVLEVGPDEADSLLRLQLTIVIESVHIRAHFN